MDVRQALLGAGVAIALVWGGNTDPAPRGGGVHAAAVQGSLLKADCKLAGIKEHMQALAERAGDAALDIVLDAAGDLEARARQML